MGFGDVQVTDNAIYAVFQGKSFKDIMESAKQGNKLPDGGQSIYVFSLRGEPLRKYVLDIMFMAFLLMNREGLS